MGIIDLCGNRWKSGMNQWFIYIICMWNNDRNVTPEENVRIVNTMQERSGNGKAIYKYNQKSDKEMMADHSAKL